MQTSIEAESRLRRWLIAAGAETIEHPGGTLYAHLTRVGDQLRRLGADIEVQLAGLAHAAYGTDGFDLALLDLAERATLREIIGPAAEALVYLYGVCDRRRTWSRLGDTSQVWNRFTHQAEPLTAAQVRSFVDLNIVNELDVIEHNPSIAEAHGAELYALFVSWSRFASPAVMGEVQRLLGGASR